MLRDDGSDRGGRRRSPRNVLGEPLDICSIKPMAGFYRDGCCNTGREDVGSHTICAVMTAAFLEFSKSRGNDLSTPVPAFGFPGLNPGDRGCLCAPRWQEAFKARPSASYSSARLSRGCSRLLLAYRSQTLRNRPCVTRVTSGPRAANSLRVPRPLRLRSSTDSQRLWASSALRRHASGVMCRAQGARGRAK
jgi:hypothetical protein